MARNYTDLYNRGVSLQGEVIPGREADMTRNSEGNAVFKLDDWMKLDRFLILGSDRPTYYIGARELTRRNASNVEALIRKDGRRVVDTIVDVSTKGRAYKNQPALFALALVFTVGDNEAKAAARVALPKVARTASHLFEFIAMVNSLRGWGSALKRAVAEWYEGKDAQKLAYQVTKYQQRGGFSHRDVLRLAHPKARDELNAVFHYAVREDENERYLLLNAAPAGSEVAAYLAAVEDVKRVSTARAVANLVKEFNLPREVIPTQFLNSIEVWRALLNPAKGKYMPITAMIRNLGAMTSKGVLKPMSDEVQIVTDRLLDPEVLNYGRVHPIQILAALLTYKNGHGARGSLSWTPVQQVVDALDEAFYLSFGAIEPTNKRRLMAIDVSSSMTWGTLAGVPGLSPNVAAAAMAMVSARLESKYYVMGFANNFRDLGVSPRMRLDEVIRNTNNMSFGSTDCALPMKWALSQGVEVDSFEVYTDSETNHYYSSVQPVSALDNYKKKTGIDATLTVVGMESNDFTIADPSRNDNLDVVGFDTSAPSVIADFVARRL